MGAHTSRDISSRVVGACVSSAILPLLPQLQLAELAADGNRQSDDGDVLSSSEEPLPLEVARFIATGSGVKWLSDTIKEWPDMLVDAADKLEDTRQQIHQAPKHLNTFVVGKYKELVRSEMGKRLINRAHLPEEAIRDPLSVPLYVVEDIVRLRLQQLLRSNWRTLAWRVCTRASLACGLLNLAKAGIKRLVRGRPRVQKTVTYICDVLMPTEFYGPLIGITWVVFQGVSELTAR